MRKTNRIFAAFLLATFLVFSFTLPCASAGGGTDVWVNGIWLNGASPYWKNGDAAASPSDWNAYFDAATSTLTLKDAVINHPFDFTSKALIYADGDLNLVLTGTNTLSGAETAAPALYGICAVNSLTIYGGGSADFQLANTYEPSAVYGIYAGESLAITSGLLTINVSGVLTHGLASPGGILIAGGETDIQANGSEQCSLVLVDNTSFRMSGGKITGTAVSNEAAVGVVSMGVVLAGGEGNFRAQSSSFAMGLFNVGPVLSVSGGSFVFSGDSGALAAILAPGDSVDLRLTNVKTYASDAADGAGKRLWDSAADGDLVGIVGRLSPFLYVEFIGSADPGSLAPQTGDAARPWLWAGIALCAALGAAGLLLIARRQTAR
jgi:hypothetical protein